MHGLFGGNPHGGDRLPARWAQASRPPHAPSGASDSSSPAQDPAKRLARIARVEAALWLATEPLSPMKLANVAGLKGVAEARELTAELRRRLAARRSAIDVVEVAGGLRMTTRPAFAPWLEKFAESATEGPSSGQRLSAAAAETLAIVAYRQPVVRAEVEAIRGVGCGDVLRQLLETDLLRIVGRSEELGRPLLYGTTGRFLELYGLGSLDDLPGRDEGAEGAGPTKHNAANESAA